MRIPFKFGTSAILGLGFLTSSASAEEKKIALNEVPKPVMAAFKAKFPSAIVKNAIQETVDGKVTYEIESVDKAGLTVDGVLKPGGEFVAIEQEIKPADLPSEAAPAVAARYPKSTITKAEAVTAGAKKSFEAVVKKSDGKSVTVIFDKDGKFVEEEK